MRDRQAYLDAGRSDPDSQEQRRQHPYDFVSLPDKPSLWPAVGHDGYPSDRLSGTLTLRYRTQSPLHIGSGIFETSRECGLEGKDQPVRGIVRKLGKPILPGSSWKGSVRSVFEAITRSRLQIASTQGREKAFKLPQAISGGQDAQIRIRDSRVNQLRALEVRKNNLPPRLSAAESLFGCLGYRGRVHPTDGAVDGGQTRSILQVQPLESPALHRLATPTGVQWRPGAIDITRVEGRKFYYDGPIVHRRHAGGGLGSFEPIDSIAPESRITIEIHLESVTLSELGALLLSAGYGNEIGILRFGGYKPAGLGEVRLEEATALLSQGPGARTWRRSTSQVDLDGAVQKSREASLIDEKALDELREITTRQRPGPEK